MFEFRLFWQHVARKKYQTSVLVFALLCAFFLLTILGSLGAVGSASPGEYGERRLISNSKVSFTQSLPLAHFNRKVDHSGIQARTHSTWFGGYFRVPQNFVLAQAVDASTYLDVFPEIGLEEDTRDRFLRNQRGMIIGEELASRFGWRAGQSVPLSSNVHVRSDGTRVWNFEIVDIFSVEDSATMENYALFHYEYLNENRVYQKDTVTQLAWLVGESGATGAIQSEIDLAYAGTQQPTQTVPESQYAQYFLAQIDGIRILITTFVVASLVSILLMITSSQMMNVRARSRDIAILKSVGFSSHAIIRGLNIQSAVVILAGGGLGTALAAVAIDYLSSAGILVGASVSFELLAMAVATMLLLSALSSTLPATLIYRVKVAEAMTRGQE